MSITTTVAASTRNLTTMATVLQDIGADGVGADLLLMESLIAQASAAIERACQTIFAQQTYTEILEQQRDPLLLLRYRPIVSVTSATIDTTAVTDYRIHNAAAGMLVRRLGWKTPSDEDPTVTVVYTAGYLLPGQTAIVASGPTLPVDLQRITLEVVKIWHAEVVPSSRISSKTLGLTGDSVAFRLSSSRESLPPLASKLLTHYLPMVLA
jgi:hypothetical protein